MAQPLGDRRRTWRFATARAATLLRWQPDQWRRMTLVAGRVPPHAARVLDVGGRGRQMAALLRPASVTTANVQPPADVIVAPQAPLPFPDAAFDVVLSTDVIEHMPPGARKAHIGELLRVARTRVVLCWPLGSPAKDAAEQRLRTRLRAELGLVLDFLEEHHRFGLPRENDVRAMVEELAPSARQSWMFQERIDAGDAMLLDALRARHRHDLRALARFLRAAYLRRAQLRPTSSSDTSRAFLVIDL